MVILLKYGLLEDGGCFVANNKSRISEKDLKNILKLIKNHYFYIVSRWKEYYGTDNTKFYC